MLAIMSPMLSFLFEAVQKDTQFHCLDNKGKGICLPGAYISFVNWTRVYSIPVSSCVNSGCDQWHVCPFYIAVFGSQQKLEYA